MLSIHRHVLKDAWDIVTKTWYLWPLGLFASLAGNGSEFQFLYEQIQIINNQQALVLKIKSLLLTPTVELFQAISNWQLVHYIVAVIFIAIILFIVWLSIASISGLVYGTSKKLRGEDSSIKELISIGNKNFFSTLTYVLIAKVFTSLLIIIIFTPLLVATYQAGYNLFNSILSFLLVVIIVPIIIVVNFITKFAITSTVLSDLKFKGAWLHSWRLFKDNWLIVLEQALLLMIINLMIGLILIIGFFVIFGPFFLLGSATYGGFFPLVVLGFFLVGLFIIFLGSLLGFFQYAAWTSLYLHLNEDSSYTAKIVRFIAGLPDYLKAKKEKLRKIKL